MKLSRNSEPVKDSVKSANFTRTDFLWLLGSLCQLYRVPFDPLLIERQFPPPCSTGTLRTSLDILGFKVGMLEFQPDKFTLDKFPLPAIGFLKYEAEETPETASAGQQDPSSNLKPILIIKADSDRMLYFRAGSQAPETALLEDVANLFSPDVILISRPTSTNIKDADIAGPSMGAAEARKFGFRWFIPELLKHKRIWREVLLASLIIQLIGLATPLFTQVVIDNVVVHQTHKNVRAS